jgi:hypothetical protein
MSVNKEQLHPLIDKHSREANVRSAGWYSPFDVINITNTHKLISKFAAIGTWEVGSGLRVNIRNKGCLTRRHGLQAAIVLIALVSRWPRCRRLGSRFEARVDIKLLGAGDSGSVVKEEVESTCLSLEGNREVEGEKCGYVRGLSILEDFTGWSVEVGGAGPDFVLGTGCRTDCVCCKGCVHRSVRSAGVWLGSWNCRDDPEEGKSSEAEKLHCCEERGEMVLVFVLKKGKQRRLQCKMIVLEQML